MPVAAGHALAEPKGLIDKSSLNSALLGLQVSLELRR
jgi:hypothetical protein